MTMRRRQRRSAENGRDKVPRVQASKTVLSEMKNGETQLLLRSRYGDIHSDGRREDENDHNLRTALKFNRIAFSPNYGKFRLRHFRHRRRLSVSIRKATSAATVFDGIVLILMLSITAHFDPHIVFM